MPIVRRQDEPIATITEPLAVRKVLTHLGLPATPLPRARARDPTEQTAFDFEDGKKMRAVVDGP